MTDPHHFSRPARSGLGWLFVAVLAGVLATMAGTLSTGIGPDRAGDARSRDVFRWDTVGYTGRFADPSITVLPDGTYLAAATTTAGLNLPLMTSPDLRTWTPRQPLASYSDYTDWPGYNEAMVDKPEWASTIRLRDDVALMSQWAPSISRIGDVWVAAYSANTAWPDERFSCIGLAHATDPLGPYTPTSQTTPLTCFKPGVSAGAIDPDLFTDPATGRTWLLWKREGVRGRTPPTLASRMLNASATGFEPGSRTTVLLERDRPWESTVVENPSMIFHQGRYWLFYSGHSWETADYATGYAVCSGPAGPCEKKTRAKPLMASTPDLAGPGGADAFHDTAGRLRLAYHAWDPFAAGADRTTVHRRLYIATLRPVAGTQRLEVTDRR